MSSEAPLFLSHTKNSALPIHCSFFFFLNSYWPLAPCKRRGSKINLQHPLGHTGSSQIWLCPAVAMPSPELTPSAVQGLPAHEPRGYPLGPESRPHLAAEKTPALVLWCAGF